MIRYFCSPIHASRYWTRARAETERRRVFVHSFINALVASGPLVSSPETLFSHPAWTRTTHDASQAQCALSSVFEAWCSRSGSSLRSAAPYGNPIPNLAEYVEEEVNQDGEKPRGHVDDRTKDLKAQY
jgi:hypothetical protein